MGVLDDAFIGDHTHGPAGKAPGDSAVIVDSLGNKYRLAAENPVSLLPVNDSEPFVDPSFAVKNVDELLQNIDRPLTGKIAQGTVSCVHVVPLFSGLIQKAQLFPPSRKAFGRPPFQHEQKIPKFDENSLLCKLRIGEGGLYVKGILTQHTGADGAHA
jgi:hypothetical protein